MTGKEKIKLRRKLFRLWAIAVKNRDGYKCVVCGKTGKGLNAHHLVSRYVKNSILKFDIKNGITLCPSHHRFNKTFSAHNGSLAFYNWYIGTYGKLIVDYLIANSEIKINLNDERILKEVEEALLNNIALIINELKWFEQKGVTTNETDKQN